MARLKLVLLVTFYQLNGCTTSELTNQSPADHKNGAKVLQSTALA